MSLFNSPLSAAKADQLISLLGMTEESRVLDAGCGSGEFLIRAIDASGATGLGIDLDESLIDDARESARLRLDRGTCEFRCADMRHSALADRTFDVAMCIGSTHAFGSGAEAFPNALRALGSLLRPSGLMLVGEGYWRQPPAAEYLQFLGDPVGVYHDHAGNIALAEALGLLPLYAAASNEDEWDHFEWSHYQRAIPRATSHADASDQAERIKRSIAWRNAYLRWGRTTMGFGFYVFETPAQAD